MSIAALLDFSADVVFFPVRHHSPACARMVQALTERLRPAAILIEGPSDFNPSFAELHLPHELPIAIYSYVRMADGDRLGAYYPFCEYSPEWRAIVTGRDVRARVQFIDLPWREMARRDTPRHRYGDAEMRGSRYIAQTLPATRRRGF